MSTLQPVSNAADDAERAYAAHVRLTASLRRVIAAKAALDLPVGDGDEIIAQVDALADRLDGLAGAGRYTDPGNPGFTASITVQLRKATPPDTELQLVSRLPKCRGAASRHGVRSTPMVS